MPRPDSPYAYLAVTIALVVAAAAVPSTGLRIVLGAVALAAAAACTVLFARQRRDPNGPRGQS